MRSERPPDLITGAGARPRQELHAAAASMGLRQVLDKLCQSSAEKGGKKGEKAYTCGPALATVGIVSRSSTDREPVPLGRSRRARVPRANLVNELVRTTPLCHRLPGSRRARPMPSSARCGRLDSWGSGGLEQYLSPKKKPRTPSCPPPPPLPYSTHAARQMRLGSRFRRGRAALQAGSCMR